MVADAGIRDHAEKLAQQLTKVEDLLVQNKHEASQDVINYPRVFTNHIMLLYGHLVGSHHRPTGGILERWTDLQAEYDHISRHYGTAVEPVQPYGPQLEAAGVPRVIVPDMVGKP